MFAQSLTVLIAIVIAEGLLLGVTNTAPTEAVMEATDLPRNVASSTYSGVRFMGGAVAHAVLGVIIALVIAGRHLAHIGRSHESAEGEAAAISAGDA